MRSRRSGPVSAALLTVPLLLGMAGAPSMRVALPGTVPTWAAPAADRGEVAGAAPVTVRVYLAGRERAGLAALARAVSDPDSRSYRHFLTPEQVRQRFGPAPGEAAGVRSWLASAGFEVAAATPRFLSVKGDADAVRRAFGIRLHSYRKDGRTFRAPAAPATVPASIASAVLSVTGLDDAPHISRPSLRPESRERPDDLERPDDREPLPPPGRGPADSGPSSAYFGEKPAAGTPAAYGGMRPYVLRGYTGSELRRPTARQEPR